MSWKDTIRPATAVLLFVVGFLPNAYSQTETATIRGSVADPSGGLIPQAIVRLIDDDRGATSEVSTTTTGFYTFVGVRPGRYRMEVSKSGFKKLVRPDVILHVQDAMAMDFELSLGATTETVTVQGGAPLVNTSDATVSTVVDQTFVENMPLNGRSFQTLIMLTPGVVVTATAFDDQGQFSVNGQRADANYFTVDGVSANFGVTGYFPLVQSGGGALPALSASGGTNSLVSVEAMQEFRVQTSSFAPEFGRTPGGQISVVTRSGSNQFHGTAFEYFRNDVLDANDWFSNRDHLPKPAARQNDFGGVFGGPILKDKTFFFFSYEGLRLRQPATQETVVPDTASRQKAPSTMQPYLNAYPVPNGAELGSGLAQFNGSYSNPSSLDAYSIRVDHGINSNLSLFGRYNYSPSQSSIRGAFGVLNTIELLSPSVQTFTVGLAYAITPQFSNELRANYSNDRVGLMYTLDGFGGAAPLPDSALFPPGFSSKNSDFLFYVSGIGEYALGRQATDEQRQVNLVDNLSIAKGGHQMKFGVDYRWLSPFVSPLAYGTFTEFTGMGTTTGGALSGTAAFADVAVFQADALLEHNFSFYGQDTWKLNPRLTLTYGLRWDINPPLKGKNLENQPFTATNLNDPAKMALAPRGTALYETTYGNVAPRIGVAYQLRQNPDWTTALRGGFGVFYDLGYGSLGGVSSYFPYRAQNNFFSTPYPLSPQQAAPPALTTNLPASEFVVADRNLKLPRTYEWNLAVEQSLATNQTISLTYVGARGDDLLRVTNIINPNPSFGQVSLTNNTAESYYHALQIKLQRRFSRGLHGLASYTFSHSIDNASTDAFANYLNTPNGGAYTSSDRGNSDFDVRHSFTADVFYDLPTPKWNSFARASLGGWSVDAFVLARSAPPVNVVGAPYFGPGGTALYPRPNVVSGVPQVLYGPQYPGGKAFNNTVIPGACPGGANQVGAWCPAPPGTQGDFGRNVLRGFGATQADVALQRRFQLTEQLNLRFRAEFFNIFNHPNFSSPNNNLTDSFFGHSTQTLANGLGSGGANGGFNPLYQIGGPRSIQLALKLAF